MASDRSDSRIARSEGSLGPSFSALLAGTFVTNLGDGIRLATLPLLATTLTSSPVMIGCLMAAQYLPWATFAPVGGVIVDRSDRRKLIMTTQSWRSLVMAILAVLVLTETVSIWHLFVVAFVITVGEILVDPSVIATVPSLVRRDDLDKANGRITTVETVTNSFAGGPVGAFTFGLAPWLPFVIDSLSYLGSVLPFSRLPRERAQDSRATGTDVAGESLRREMGEGLKWLRGHQFLWPLTLATAVFHLGTAGAMAMLVLLVTQELEASSMAFGLVLAAAAVGATLASLAASRLTARFGRRATVCAAATGTGLSVLAAASSLTIWQLVVATMVNGASSAVHLAVARGFIQRHTPNELLGRAAISSRMITRSTFVVGGFAAGLIAAATSVRWSFAVAGCLHLVGAAFLWRSFRHEPV